MTVLIVKNPHLFSILCSLFSNKSSPAHFHKPGKLSI